MPNENQNNGADAPATQNQSLAISQENRNISDSVLQKVELLQQTGGLNIPKDYSAANALKAAWLILQTPKSEKGGYDLKALDKTSVANALFKMVVMGLNPLKKQCSFITYGNQLQCQREYQGTIALAGRYGLKSCNANIIYKGDEFEYEVEPATGLTRIAKHKSTIESLGKEIVGAYCVYTTENGVSNTEIMSMDMIRNSWEQGAMRGNSPAHKNFPDQMCKKTVINRALKTVINSSNDANLIDDEEESAPTVVERSTANLDAEKASKANIHVVEIVAEESSSQDNTTIELNPISETEKAPFE